MALKGDVMNCRCHAVGLSLMAMLALAPESAWCQAKPELSLKLKMPAASGTAAPAAFARSQPITVANGVRRGPRFQQVEPSLSQRALESLLDNADVEPQAVAGQDGSAFRFDRRGSAGHDLSQGYKAMCERATSKLWDEPNGKRVKFDIAGKPGIAIEIPLR